MEDSHEIIYSKEVSPIIAHSCAVPNCHVANFPKGDFTNFNDLKNVAANGKLYFRLSSGQMPPANSKIPSLSACEIGTITAWINQGVKNN
jgi:hypothetical protein